MIEKVKEIYYAFEDKWYELLDALDRHIPVYKIINPIDEKVPSFLLFLFLAFLLGLVIVSPIVLPGKYSFQIIVAQEDGSPIPEALVKIYSQEGEEIANLQTDDKGKTEEIKISEGTYFLEIEKKGYKKIEKEIEVKANFKDEIFEMEEAEKGEYTILFKDNDGSPITGRIDLTFQCSNPAVQPPLPKTIFNSIFKITEPEGCGLIITAKTERGEQTIRLNPSIKTKSVKFEEQEGGKKNLTIRIRQNDFPIEGLVKIYQEGIQIDSGYSSTGTINFQLNPGRYEIIFENPQYKRTSREVVLDRDKTIEIEAELNPVGTIDLVFEDENTGERINTNIFASLKKEEQVISEKETSSGEISFGIFEDIDYDLVIDAQDYCVKYINGIRKGSHTIKLKRFNNDCGASLKVKVIDSERKPLANAKVGLYNNEGIKIGINDAVSNAEGIAEFEHVPSGTYKAFAIKGYLHGWSTAEVFSQRDPDRTQLIVAMVSKKGKLKVEIKDNEDNPVNYAHIAFLDNFGELVGGGLRPVEGSQYVLETSADKKVSVIVRKEGYSDYVSEPISIEPDIEKEIKVNLSRPRISGEVKIDFLGIYKDNSKIVSVQPGEKYDLLFRINIPKNKDYDKIGAHIRVGEKIKTELDEIEIVKVLAPGETSIVKGGTYEEENQNNERLVEGEAKWVNIEWDMENTEQKFRTGDIYFKVKVKVKETAKLNSEDEIYYRAWAEENGETIKDPEDNKNSSDLYSKTYSKKIAIGGETKCEDGFCFSATIVDLEENIGKTIADTYTAKNYNNYAVSINILNNGPEIYPNGEIQIDCDNITIKDYSIYGGTNLGEEGNLGKNKTQWISIGDLEKNYVINGYFTFLTEKEGTSQIRIRIKAMQQIVFEKSIILNIEANKEINAIIEPTFLPSGKEADIEITAKEGNMEISNAEVRAKDKYGEIIARGYTNSMGYLKLRIPGQQPGEKIKIEIRKNGYKTFEQDIEIDSKVLEIPENIGISINALLEQEAEKSIIIRNRTNPLQIKEIKIEDGDKRILDIDRMEQWLNSTYAGQTIEDSYELKVKIYPMKINQNETQNIKLKMVVESDSIIWEQEIPINISLVLGKGVDEPSCLIINKKNLEITTEGQPITLEYEIRNGCTIDGKPIKLRNLKAKAKWSQNELGTISADLGNSIIISNYYQKLLPEMDAEESQNLIIRFTPYAGITDKGEVEIEFKAENPTEKGIEEIKTNTKVKVDIANLEDCIVIDKPIMYILPDKQETFTIEARGCSADLKIEADKGIEISRKEIKLKENQSIPITVFAKKTAPGQYNINIKGKTTAQSEERYLHIVKARVLDECYDLSAYEYSIFDDPNKEGDGYQDAYLENRCYQKEITVNYYWKEKKKKFDWKNLITIAGVSYLGYDIYKEITDKEHSGLIEWVGLGKNWEKSKQKTTGKFSLNPFSWFAPSSPKKTGGTNWPILLTAGIELMKYLQPEYDEGSISVNKIVVDEEIKDLKLIDATQNQSQDIGLEVLNKSTKTNRKDRKLKNQEWELRFKNNANIVQEDMAKPFVRWLNIIGKSYEYATEYKTSSSSSRPEPKPKASELINKKFRLVFTSINPKEIKKQPQPIPNCVLGNKVGLTGKQAVPKVRYAWSWNNQIISSNTCDKDNENYIYCDAVQFTIETIKKLKEINDFLEKYGSDLVCPLSNSSAVSSQEIRTTAKDIALTKLMAQPIENGTKIILQIESNNNKENEVVVSYRIEGDITREFERTYSVLSKEIVEEEVEEMQDGNYKITAEIKTINFYDDTCKDEDSENNKIEVEIDKRGEETRDCRKSLDRLYLFIDQTEAEGRARWTTEEKERVLKDIQFTAHLMKDAYNEDLKNDLDKYSKENSFFDTPEYYEADGFDELLKELEFDYVGKPNYLDAGIYDAEIKIEFGDDWKIFDSNKPVVKPKIKLTRLDAPRPDNPFYYLPLDGKIGLDSENGRQGYGINFKQESEEVILFNAPHHALPSTYNKNVGEYQPIMSYNNPKSNPITGGYTKVEKIKNFAKQNVKERGIILEIKKDDDIEIKFSPSYATPIFLELNYDGGGKAYVLYSLEVDGTPQTTTSSLLKWNGVGNNCKDFEDYPMMEYWREVPDKHALANSMSCAPQQGITDYGIEWCNPKHTGKVFLESVVFTPQQTKSKLILKTSNGLAKITSGRDHTIQGTGEVPLNGVNSIPYNYTENNLTSIDQVFELVENNWVCVVGTGSDAKFFWNPKKILDEAYRNKTRVENECIQD